MEKKINIVVDTSGSMAEDGKNTVVKYLLNGICSAGNSAGFENIVFELYQWGKETKRIDDIRKAKLAYFGKADKKGLDILNQMITGEASIVLISDGNIEAADKKHLKEMGKNIFPIYLGADANRALLKEVSAHKTVYSVVDFMQALWDAQNN